MKFLVKAIISTEAGNENIVGGTMMAKMKSYTETVKAEAVYFSIAHGKRTVFFVIDVPSPEKLPVIAEPLWNNLNAKVHFMPIIEAKDLEKAMPNVMKALGK